MKKYIADCLTILRIVCSVSMLFFTAFSVRFYALYIFCGISDMCDGAVARKTNSESRFGAMLDTVADLVFVVVAMIKILPELNVQKWLLIWIAVIAIIKIFNIVFVMVCRKSPEKLHTFMNRVTGAMLFLLPMTIHIIDLKCSLLLVCCVATFSVFHEWIDFH